MKRTTTAGLCLLACVANPAHAIHAMGLKAGIHSGIGQHACGHAFGAGDQCPPRDTRAEKRVGLEGRTDADINTDFAGWAGEFIKVAMAGSAGAAPGQP